jgi:hypothetical protein
MNDLPVESDSHWLEPHQIHEFERRSTFESFKEKFCALLSYLVDFVKNHHGDADTVEKRLDRFSGRLFDPTHEEAYGPSKAVVYGFGFHTIKEIVRLLDDENLPPEHCVTTIENLAQDVQQCPDGAATALVCAAEQLRLMQDNDAIYSLKGEMARQLINEYIVHLSRDRLIDESMEIHYVNFFNNALSEQLGLRSVEDSYATGECKRKSTQEEIDDCLQYVLKKMTPARLALMLADDLRNKFGQAMQNNFTEAHEKFGEILDTVQKTNPSASFSSKTFMETLNAAQKANPSASFSFETFIKALDTVQKINPSSSFSPEMSMEGLNAAQNENPPDPFAFAFETFMEALNAAQKENPSVLFSSETFMKALVETLKAEPSDSFSFEILRNALDTARIPDVSSFSCEAYKDALDKAMLPVNRQYNGIGVPDFITYLDENAERTCLKKDSTAITSKILQSLFERRMTIPAEPIIRYHGKDTEICIKHHGEWTWATEDDEPTSLTLTHLKNVSPHELGDMAEFATSTAIDNSSPEALREFPWSNWLERTDIPQLLQKIGENNISRFLDTYKRTIQKLPIPMRIEIGKAIVAHGNVSTFNTYMAANPYLFNESTFLDGKAEGILLNFWDTACKRKDPDMLDAVGDLAYASISPVSRMKSSVLYKISSALHKRRATPAPHLMATNTARLYHLAKIFTRMKDCGLITPRNFQAILSTTRLTPLDLKNAAELAVNTTIKNSTSAALLESLPSRWLENANMTRLIKKMSGKDLLPFLEKHQETIMKLSASRRFEIAKLIVKHGNADEFTAYMETFGDFFAQSGKTNGILHAFWDLSMARNTAMLKATATLALKAVIPATVISNHFRNDMEALLKTIQTRRSSKKDRATTVYLANIFIRASEEKLAASAKHKDLFSARSGNLFASLHELRNTAKLAVDTIIKTALPERLLRALPTNTLEHADMNKLIEKMRGESLWPFLDKHKEMIRKLSPSLSDALRLEIAKCIAEHGTASDFKAYMANNRNLSDPSGKSEVMAPFWHIAQQRKDMDMLDIVAEHASGPVTPSMEKTLHESLASTAADSTEINTVTAFRAATILTRTWKNKRIDSTVLADLLAARNAQQRTGLYSAMANGNSAQISAFGNALLLAADKGALRNEQLAALLSGQDGHSPLSIALRERHAAAVTAFGAIVLSAYDMGFLDSEQVCAIMACTGEDGGDGVVESLSGAAGDTIEAYKDILLSLDTIDQRKRKSSGREDAFSETIRNLLELSDRFAAKAAEPANETDQILAA